jgi:hypothetical protein
MIAGLGSAGIAKNLMMSGHLEKQSHGLSVPLRPSRKKGRGCTWRPC